MAPVQSLKSGAGLQSGPSVFNPSTVTAQHPTNPSRLKANTRVIRPIYLAISILLVAANLRHPITVVGPLVEQIGTQTDISLGTLGILGSIPLIGFAIVSPLVSWLGARWGIDRTIFRSLIVLLFGTLLRSFGGVAFLPEEFALFAGTILLSFGIGVCNVLVPAVVKRDFNNHIPQMTGLYTGVMAGFAALASFMAVPLTDGFTWEIALGSTALIGLVATFVWRPRLQTEAHQAVPASIDIHSAGHDTRKPSNKAMWRSALAWQVTLYFGLQCGIFFIVLTWFPAILTSQGISNFEAGVWLAIYQAIGIFATLLLGYLMPILLSLRVISCGMGITLAMGFAGMAIWPNLFQVWTLISGFGTGGAVLAAMSLISMRSRNAHAAGQLSGMAQGTGFLLASIGPAITGMVYQLTNTWTLLLLLVSGLALIQAVCGFLAGRNRHTH